MILVKHAAGTLDFTLKCPIELLKAQREHMSDYLLYVGNPCGD